MTASSHQLFPASRVARSIPSGSTTIVIPVRNQIELLRSCLRSIQPVVTAGKVDVMIVDNDSSDPEMLKFLNDLNGNAATVVSVPGHSTFLGSITSQPRTRQVTSFAFSITT